MPTGYTAFIEDGKITTGNDFILLCSRAFGALVEMRDEQLDAPIPDSFKPSDYHKKQIEIYERDLKRFESMTEEEAQAEIDAAHEEENRSMLAGLEHAKQKNATYEKVLAEVRKWEPPTPEHNGVKDYAIEQIEMCMDSDYSFYEKRIGRPKMPAREWLDFKIERMKENIDYHKKEWMKEKARCESRNLWIRQLKESLGGDAV